MEIWLFSIGLLIIFVVALIVYYRFGPVSHIIHKDVSGNNTEQVHIRNKDISGSSPPKTDKVVFIEDKIQKPYNQTPIQNVDDYEYSLIFKNEGDRAMTKKTRDLLMSQYPKDWSVQPPSSDLFQQGLQAYQEGFENEQDPSAEKKRYAAIDGSKMTPPDSSAKETSERDILQTYVPKEPQSLTTYNAGDAKILIEKIYSAKGLVPTYEQTGENQFQITRTTPINQVVVYEDDPSLQAGGAPTSSGPVKSAGEDTIVVPNIQPTGGLDPFFTPGEQTRDGRWDYTKFTPGLERMFAPTEPMQKWY